MKSIQTAAIITGIRAKVDRSLSFSATTPELTAEEKVAFMELQGINTTMVIVPSDERNVPEIKVKGDLERRTPSQRLRGVLYVLWDKNRIGTFDNFYIAWIEKFIDDVKSFLEGGE